MERDRDRPFRQKRREADDVPVLVGQDERRHRIARMRRAFAAAIVVNPRHQAIDRLAIGRKELPPRRGISLQLLAQRPVHVAAGLKGQLETLGIGRR